MKLNPVVPAAPKYPFKLKVDVEWPNTVEYKGNTYFFYNKEGLRLSDQCPSACYRHMTDEFDQRLWLGLDGKIEED